VFVNSVYDYRMLPPTRAKNVSEMFTNAELRAIVPELATSPVPEHRALAVTLSAELASWVRPSTSWPSRLPVPDDDPLGLED
jgi:hypothetical protein